MTILDEELVVNSFGSFLQFSFQFSLFDFKLLEYEALLGFLPSVVSLFHRYFISLRVDFVNRNVYIWQSDWSFSFSVQFSKNISLTQTKYSLTHLLYQSLLTLYWADSLCLLYSTYFFSDCLRLLMLVVLDLDWDDFCTLPVLFPLGDMYFFLQSFSSTALGDLTNCTLLEVNGSPDTFDDGVFGWTPIEVISPSKFWVRFESLHIFSLLFGHEVSDFLLTPSNNFFFILLEFDSGFEAVLSCFQTLLESWMVYLLDFLMVLLIPVKLLLFLNSLVETWFKLTEIYLSFALSLLECLFCQIMLFELDKSCVLEYTLEIHLNQFLVFHIIKNINFLLMSV